MSHHPTHPEQHRVPEANEQAPDIDANILRRNELTRLLSREELDLESAEAHDLYTELVDSALEAARNGEVTTSTQEEPLTEEQLLSQVLDAFKYQRGEIRDMGGSGHLFLPRSAGMRATFVRLLGPMEHSSEPTRHAAAVEGFVRERYDTLMNPQDSIEVEVVESQAETPEAVTPEVVAAEEEVSSPEAYEPSESQISIEHERQMQRMNESLQEVLGMAAGRVDDFEQASVVTERIHQVAAQDLAEIAQMTYRLDNLPTEGARTQLVNINERLHHLAGGLLRAEAALTDPNAAVQGIKREVQELRAWAENVDAAAAAEYAQYGYTEAAEQAERDGAAASHESVERAVELVDPVQKYAHELAAVNAQGAQQLRQLAGRLDEAVRQSYTTNRIDSEEVTQLVRMTLQQIESSGARQGVQGMTEAAQRAVRQLTEARAEIEDR